MISSLHRRHRTVEFKKFLKRPGFGGGSNSTERWSLPAPRKYPNELRDRAQRMVAEAMSEDPSLSMNAAVKRIAPKVGVVPDTLRGWVRRAEIDDGGRPGTTTVDAASIRKLQAEVRELKRANLDPRDGLFQYSG